MPRPKHTDQLPERIAARVRQARAQKGWTQEQLAEALDVATETISRYEVGRFPPSLPMLSRLADALEVDLQSLLGMGPAGLTSVEAELLEGWRGLDSEEQSIVLKLVHRLGSGRAQPKRPTTQTTPRERSPGSPSR